MITCNRCGYSNPANAVECQMCRAALHRVADTAMSSGTAFQQPELPAWLESLRSAEKPTAANNGSANFHASDLIDEGSLPSWMRPDRGSSMSGEMPELPSSQPHTLRPASSAAPDTDESYFQGGERGISAHSLIDEQALPPWMIQGQGLQGTGSAQTSQRNISASSLIQSDAVPEWMKTLQQSSPPAAPPQPSMQPAQPAFPATPPSSQGFSAKDLIDPQVLPSWMSGQSNQPINATPPQQQMPPSAGFSASSLLDMDALPQWMREVEQGRRQQSAGSFSPEQARQGQHNQPDQQYAQNPYYQQQQPPQPAAHPNAVWQPTQQQPEAWNQQGQQPAQGNNFSASSLIDPASLPEWLRQSAGQQSMASGQSMQQGAPRAGGNPMQPPRVENMRVPSRPRGDASANESSEVAANVFASMLGVASTAPHFSPTGSGQQQGQSVSLNNSPAQGTPQGMAGPPSQQVPPSQQPPSPQQGMNGAYGQYSSPSQNLGGAYGPPPQPQQPPQGYMPNGYSGYSGNPGNPGNPQGNYPVGIGNLAMSPQQGKGEEHQESAKPVKRGLFEAIRNWLSGGRQ